MPKYLSGRFKKTPQTQLTSDRYRYLSVEDAEPDLGDPLVGPSSIGAKPAPPGNQYIIVAIGSSTGERFWIPNQGGIIPGSISVFDEGILTPVGGLSSITQLNFVGAAVSAKGYLNPDNSPGVAATITIFAPGNNQEILFNTSNEFSTSSKLKFDSSIGLLSAGDRIIVGAGGTVITTTGNGFVGIGTTNPTQELHVQGDLRLTGTVYDYNNNPGNPQEILVKNNFGGLTWVNQSTVRAGAGGTYTNIQYHNNAGLVDGAPSFVFDPVNNRVGIGSTIPTALLDVLGYSKFTGQTEIDRLNVTGVATISTLGVTGTTTTTNLQVFGITTVGFITGTNAYFSGIITAQSGFVGSIDITTANIGTLKVSGLTTTRDLQVYESTLLNRLKVSGISTFDTQVNINNLNVTGVGTFDNIKLDTNTISTLTGNLILDSQLGITQISDELYVNDTTESIDKNTGSIITEGGVGIEKNLNVGGESSLALNGGITTTGGDLYVGSNLYVKLSSNFSQINAKLGIFEDLRAINLDVSGITTLSSLNVNNNSRFTGIATFNGNVNIGDAITDIVTVKSSVGSGLTPSANNVHQLGSLTNKWSDVYATRFNGSFLGNADTATKLQTPRAIDIDGDVIGVGIGTTFDGSKDVTIQTILSNTGVTPGTYGSSTQVGRFSVDSKGRITDASNVSIDFSTATAATQVSTSSTIGISSQFLTFVRNNNATSTNEFVFTDFDLSYNPSSNQLNVSQLNVYNRVNSNLIPFSNLTFDLGSPSNRWNNIYGNVVGTLIGAASSINVLNDNINSNRYVILSSTNTNSGITSAYVDDNFYYNTSTDVLTLSKVKPTSILDGSNGTGTSNQILTANGSGGWFWASLNQINYADNAGIATNLKGGVAFQIPYQSSPNTTQFIPNGTIGQLLQSNGTSSAPSWVDTVNLTAGKAVYADNAGISTNIKGGSGGSIPYQSSANTTTFVPVGIAGSILTSDGSKPIWSPPSTFFVGRASYADNAGISTNIKGGSGGSIPYQSSANTTTFVPVGIAGSILTSNGSIPVWSPPSVINSSLTANSDATNVDQYPIFVSAIGSNQQARAYSGFVINPGNPAAPYLRLNGFGDFTTPNSGTTGGIRIRANPTTNLSYLQFTNSSATSELLNAKVTPGNIEFSGSVSIIGVGTVYTNRIAPVGGSLPVSYWETADATTGNGVASSISGSSYGISGTGWAVHENGIIYIQRTQPEIFVGPVLRVTSTPGAIHLIVSQISVATFKLEDGTTRLDTIVSIELQVRNITTGGAWEPLKQVYIGGQTADGSTGVRLSVPIIYQYRTDGSSSVYEYSFTADIVNDSGARWASIHENGSTMHIYQC